MSTSQPNEEVIHQVENVNKEESQTGAPEKEKVKDRSWYLPLYSAALKGDWESAKKFFEQHEDAITAYVGVGKRTALHIVVGTGRAIHFVRNLVNMMPIEALALQDIYGNTALHNAAMIGYTEAAVILVEKNRALLNTRILVGILPVHWAAVCGYKDTLKYLLVEHYKDASESLTGNSGVELLVRIIDSGFFDVALDFIKHYPGLALLKIDYGISALNTIATKASAFPSGKELKHWERLIYSCVPVKFEDGHEKPNSNGVDIEDQVEKSEVLGQMCASARLIGRNIYHCVWLKLYLMLWEAIKFFVPHTKDIQNAKLMHHQALRLVEILCKEIKTLNDAEAHASLNTRPVLDAAQLGIREVVEKIVEEFPDAAYSNDRVNNYYILHVAVIHRCKNIFNLANQANYYSQNVTLFKDTHGNNILHLAGKLAPLHKLNLVPGAALQMQSELQWFKTVETLMIPSFKTIVNSFGETPAMVFTREHKKLVEDGEKWMKDTANSCTIAAALIVTVVFAAAITVPGGNNQDNGHPIFHKKTSFILFAISDAVSLFTSTTSLLMFLSILTSRYAESDFLIVLPRRLVIGLVTLFLSITTMMMAFCATIYLVFDGGKAWYLVPMVALASLPVTSFVLLQFPLLVDVIRSTYRPGIFGKQSDSPFN